MKHIIAIALLSLAAATGCSDEDTFVDTCLASCDHLGAATNCPESVATDDVEECRATCEPYSKMFDDECKAALEALLLCEMDNVEYKCDDGDDEPYAEFGPDEEYPCEAEMTAWAPCFMER